MTTPTWAVAVSATRVGEAVELTHVLVSAEARPDRISIVFQGSPDHYALLSTEINRVCEIHSYDGLILSFDAGYGVSRSRNIAMRQLPDNMDWVWTPNDTSRPGRDFLSEVRAAIKVVPADCGALAVDYYVHGRPRRMVSDKVELRGWSIWRAIEPALLWRRWIFQELGGFDERLGSGSPSLAQSGEATDLLCRMARKGVSISTARLVVDGSAQHTDPRLSARIGKEFFYSLGFGYVARRYFLSVRAFVAIGTPLARWLARTKIEGDEPKLTLACAASVGRALGLLLGPVTLRLQRRRPTWR